MAANGQGVVVVQSEASSSLRSWPCTSFRSVWEQLHLLTIETSTFLPSVRPWLLEGTRAFAPFTQESYNELERATNHVQIGLKLPKGSEAIQQKRKHLALFISQILDLDAIQTYVLLHKYEAQQASLGQEYATASENKHGLNSGSGSGSGSGTNGIGNGGSDQFGIVFKACEFYFQERQALLECVLELLRNDLRDETGNEVSVKISNLLGRSDKDAMLERTMSSLQASMEFFPSHRFSANYGIMQGIGGVGAQGGSSGSNRANTLKGCLGKCPNKALEAGLEKYWTEQQTLEQLLLTQQIFLYFYHEENVPTKALLGKLTHFVYDLQPDGLLGSQAFSEVALKNTLSTMNTVTFAFIEMLDVDGLLELLASGNESGGGGALDRMQSQSSSPDLSKWIGFELTLEQIERLSQPHLTLVWSVFQQLMQVLNPSHSPSPNPSPDQVAMKAISQGALDKIMFALKDEVVHSSKDSTAFHSVLKNFISALLVAFELNPKKLPQDMLESLTRVLSLSLSGEPALVEQFWNEEYILDQPIRNFLGECQQLFPSLPTPYMRLLQALCEAVDEANANLVNDQVLAHFRDLRSVSVFHAPTDLMDAASEMHIRHQVQERLVLQVGRQVRILKDCLYQIPDCPGLFIDDKVVGNVLEYYQGGRDTSESKYLVSWVVSIDGYFLILSRLHSFSLAQDMTARSEEIQLSFELLSSVLTNSMNHWEELMTVNIEDNEIRLLDVAALIFERYRSALFHAKREEVGVCLQVLSSCLKLAIAVSTCDPQLVANWLRSIVGGTGINAGSNLSDPSQCIPVIADIYKKEVSVGDFGFTITFLRLANHLVEKAVAGPESVAFVYFATFGVLSNIQTMTFLTPDHQLNLVTCAFEVIQNSLRVYQLFEDMRETLDRHPIATFDWPARGRSFSEDMEAFLKNKFSLPIIARSSLILSYASETEMMHMKGQNFLASKMEAAVQAAGRVLLRLLALTEKEGLNEDLLSCIVSSLVPNGWEGMIRIITSYCEYQFDFKGRKLAFDVLKTVVGFASKLDATSILQCCYPYSLTSADCSNFLQLLAASLSERSLMDTPDLFSSAIHFLTHLVHTKYPFPPVMIPRYDSSVGSSPQRAWIHNISQCLLNEECQSKQPAAYCSLVEFLDFAWVTGLSFVTQGILETKATWKKIEGLATEVQHWASLNSQVSGSLGENDFSQDYQCRIHACALNILANEFFLISRGFNFDEERASSIKQCVESNIFQIMLEFASIKIDVTSRLRLQVKLKSALIECSSISKVFSHQGIRSILDFVQESFPKGFYPSDDQLHGSDFEDNLVSQLKNATSPQDFSLPIEHLLLCCVESEPALHSILLQEYKTIEADKFAVDFSILYQDYNVMQKIERIQTLLKKINAHSQIEAAAMSLSKALSSITFIAKEQKHGNHFGLVDLPDFLVCAVESLNSSLVQLTNHSAPEVLFVPLMPVEELVIHFHKSLVQVCSNALTIGLDHDLMEDGWFECIFYVKGEEGSTEWMHNWLTFLLRSQQGKKDSGVDMSVKILSLLRMVYSNSGEGTAYIAMETVLRSFALACSFCHSSKDLKLYSLLTMKCILDDWLSPKLSQGDWIPLLEESPAKIELCRLGEESYSPELRSMALVTATSILETSAGSRILIDWWKEFGTFRQLIKYAGQLVSDRKSKSEEWCSWLELVGTLLHVCSEMTSSTDGLSALRVFTSALADELHPYIVDLLSSFANHERRLELRELIVVKHIAFLMYALTKFAGRWHLALPNSMINVQHAVVLYLVYAAQPALKPYFSVESQVSDEAEASMCKLNEDFPVLEGWFAAVRVEMAKGPKSDHMPSSVYKGSSLLRKSPQKDRVGTDQYSFQVAHTMYTNVCYFLEFFLISLPSSGSTLLNADAFHESFIISLIGIQIQSIHLSAGLCNIQERNGKHGKLLELFGRILNLSTFVQDVAFKTNFEVDKHGRRSWRLMSNLTAAYALLKRSTESLLATIDLSAADSEMQRASEKILCTLKAGGERWAENLIGEEALLTTASLYR